MGRHTYIGQLAAHDVMNGIDHANIAAELAVENWETKAIIRGGNYVWVLKGTHKDEQGAASGYYYFWSVESGYVQVPIVRTIVEEIK